MLYHFLTPAASTLRVVRVLKLLVFWLLYSLKRPSSKNECRKAEILEAVSADTSISHPPRRQKIHCSTRISCPVKP